MPWLRSAELHYIVPTTNSLLHNSRSPHNSIPALRLSPQRIHRFHLPPNLLSALQLAANFILLPPFISATLCHPPTQKTQTYLPNNDRCQAPIQEPLDPPLPLGPEQLEQENQGQGPVHQGACMELHASRKS